MQSGGGNPALRFLYGQLNGSSVGALTAWRIGVWAALFGALMTTFIVVRHTRGDEEAGRLELVGSAAVGRQAALTAGLLTAVTANVTVSALLCVVLSAIGLPASGSVAFALAIGASGLAFTGVAAVAAQLASGARGARGICFGVLGAAFVLRAIGDSAGPSGPSWLSWTSPLGWVELTRPFDGQRWWVLALPCAVLAAGVGSAYALSARRDLGAGLLPDRPGPASAPALLRGPLSLAWRLQRGVLAGWAAGVAFIFATSGAAAKGIGSLLGGSTQLRNEFTRLGGQAAITNAYLAALMMLAGLGAAGYATSAVLRLRTEETGGLAEPLLATAVGRIRWGLQPPGRGGLRHRGPAGPGRPGDRPGLRAAHRVARPAGGADARRGHGPAARVPGDSGSRGRAGRAAARRLGGRGVDRARRGGRHRPVRRGSPAIPLAAGHLTVHARPESSPAGPCPPRRCSGCASPPSRSPPSAWPRCAAATSADVSVRRQAPTMAWCGSPRNPEFGDRTLHTVADKL